MRLLYLLEELAIIVVAGFILAYVLWLIGQFIGWVKDEIALMRARK